MKTTGLSLSLFSILSFCSFADEIPFSAELIFDSSRIKQNGQYTQVSRSLITLSYEQSFALFGGQLTPQIAYSAFRGKNGSNIAQDIQGFSNIDADHFSAFQEVDLQWQNDRTMLRLGQLDANANFVALDNAAPFINASFGLTPTAYPMPTYPEMNIGFYIKHHVTDTLAASFGYYRPDQADDTGEKKPLWMTSACWYCTDDLTIATGYWQVRHQHADSARGYFAYTEGNISSAIHGFALVSTNNSSQHEKIKNHVKTGLLVDSPFGFTERQLGLAYSRVLGPDNETAIEAFYLIPINNYITLQPDIQWIDNKVAPQIDSVIATLRVQFRL